MRLASKKQSAAGAYNHDSPRSNRFSIYPAMVHNIRFTLAHTGTMVFESTKITTHKDAVRTCCTSLPQSILNLPNGPMLFRDPNTTNFPQFLALKFDARNQSGGDPPVPTQRLPCLLDHQRCSLAVHELVYRPSPAGSRVKT